MLLGCVATALLAPVTLPVPAEEYGVLAALCADPDTVHFHVLCGPVWLPIADRDLAIAYQKLLSRVDGVEAQKLQQSQREWVKFRDADAEVGAYQYPEGEQREAVMASHLYRSTRERLKYLEERLKAFDKW